MPIIPCPDSSPCIDPANPVTNYSTEAPDPNTFLSLQWPWLNPDNPVGGGPGPNVPPPTWSADGCQSECVSTVSQLDADLCAARQAFTCANQQDGALFGNQQVTVTVNCPDGNPFTYVVAPNLFVAGTQAGANAQALAFAELEIRFYLTCFGDIAPEACQNQSYTTTVSLNRPGPFTIQSISSLPFGLNFVQNSPNSFMLVGTPTFEGSQSFSIRAVDALGNSMTKVFTLCVIAISPTNPSLLSATVGSAYSQQLSATACASTPLSWQVTSGALPPGLTLNESTGVISGTPTQAGTFSFTVTLQTGAS